MSNIIHESAILHVTGEAKYIDDIQVSARLLHAYLYYSPVPKAKIRSYDITKAINFPGVHAVLSHKDIKGHNQMGAIYPDEPVLAEDKVNFIGQAVFLIAAETEIIARKAAKLIEVEYDEQEPVLSLEKSVEKGWQLHPPRIIESGNIEEGFANSDYIIDGELHTGAQEHWYLETQSCLCIPGEDNDIRVFSSTQNPRETQLLVAEVLGISLSKVEVEVRRMGGAFGGKETQASHTAVWTAILANHLNRPVKLKLFRDDDQKITGKRHPVTIKYKAGFSAKGMIKSVDFDIKLNAGASHDLTMAILERAMFHADNSYYIPNCKITASAWKTNLPPNTAFRGFGGPQAMASVENLIDKIARKLNIDAAKVRKMNFYGNSERNITPYGMKVDRNQLNTCWEKLNKSSKYFERRKEIDEFNRKNEFYKKGIALTPVKFGISFTNTPMNQAGALVNIYKDGTILVNHGGTEMGQGLHTKIQHIAAKEFGVEPKYVKISATNTSKVPNTSPTAASTGSDLNGMAVKNAADKLKKRMTQMFVKIFNKENPDKQSSEENIRFADNQVFDCANNTRKISFANLAKMFYTHQVSSSATGFYKTPDIYFDKNKGKGKPFHYFSFGMSVTEVLLDVLTGEITIPRTDIIHDCGTSLNPNLDIGQIEGGYIQGLGWCTGEDCKWDTKGNLITHSPDTYKIPGIGNIPINFNTSLLGEDSINTTIGKSKAVGEPPFMLALSAWLAIKDAISAVDNHKTEPEFHLPASNEKILLCIDKIKKSTNK